jgi:DNA-binding IclR family transcriptional regulator
MRTTKLAIYFENWWYIITMVSWGFLTSHARVLLCIARDPGVRLRDIASSLGITERSAHSIVTDLTAAGYVVKQKDGRRNRYQIQAHMPLREPASREPAIGEVLALLADTRPAHHRTARASAPAASGMLQAQPQAP